LRVTLRIKDVWNKMYRAVVYSSQSRNYGAVPFVEVTYRKERDRCFRLPSRSFAKPCVGRRIVGAESKEKSDSEVDGGASGSEEDRR
jgi:hypothetical protein